MYCFLTARAINHKFSLSSWVYVDYEVCHSYLLYGAGTVVMISVLFYVLLVAQDLGKSKKCLI